MSNGRYSDDTREDSLFRDDEMRLLEELEKILMKVKVKTL